MTISILGCGWYGLPLAKSLIERGHHVNGSTTHAAKFPNLKSLGIEAYLLDLYAPNPFDEATHRFFDCDALVVTVPPKNNPGYVGMIRELVGHVLAHNVPKLIYISSTGVYGEPNKKVDELSPTLPLTTNAKAHLAAENALREAPALNTICLRFAGLVGPGRSPAGFIKLTKKDPNGLAPINLIHLQDGVALSIKLLEGSYNLGTLNAVAPHHPTRAAFYSLAASAAAKPVADFTLEKKSWKLVHSRYASSLLEYKFQVDNWFRWLSRNSET